MLIEISELLRVWIDGKLCIQECRDESEIYNYQRIRLSQNKFINGILRGGGGYPWTDFTVTATFPRGDVTLSQRQSFWKGLTLSDLDVKSPVRFRTEQLQSNPAISNSVNSKSPLFRRKNEFPWIYPSPLRFPGYFETPLFRTFFHFPWDFEIAGFDCNEKTTRLQLVFVS